MAEALAQEQSMEVEESVADLTARVTDLEKTIATFGERWHGQFSLNKEVKAAITELTAVTVSLRMRWVLWLGMALGLGGAAGGAASQLLVLVAK